MHIVSTGAVPLNPLNPHIMFLAGIISILCLTVEDAFEYVAVRAMAVGSMHARIAL
jgi:hypothetical protein